MSRTPRSIAVIPIKTNSVRVPGKNFRPIAGKPLYCHIIDHALESKAFDTVLVDTDSEEIQSYARSQGCEIYRRPAEMTQDNINGNDLLVYLLDEFKNYDLVFQLFATAPLLSPSTMKACSTHLAKHTEHDSILTVTEEAGWYWFEGLPVNYQVHVLPRSQDAKKVVKETTGLYGIRRETLEKYRCRIGARPYFHQVEPTEAVDLDTEHDFRIAEALLLAKGGQR